MPKYYYAKVNEVITENRVDVETLFFEDQKKRDDYVKYFTDNIEDSKLWIDDDGTGTAHVNDWGIIVPD